jgi:histidine phosphotransferase ChpT
MMETAVPDSVLPDKPDLLIPDLAALVAARICHDLISPIGAVSNGVELMMMEGATTGPELALVAESVLNATARIRLFRMAFGAAAPGQRVAPGEIRAVLDDLMRQGRVSLQWDSAGDLARDEVKIVLLLVMCLESALAYGGRIQVTQDGTSWRVLGRADRLRVDPGLWARLTTPDAAAPVLPADVHFTLAAAALAARGTGCRVTLTATEIGISF